MWVRKRIDIRPRDIVASFARCLTPDNAGQLTAQVQRQWGDDALVLLSVRSGFDLLLGQVSWPRGSEVLMSGLTIPDMPKIVSEHGYVPVGIDIDLRNYAPDLDHLEHRVTPRTKALVVAHLFGGLCDMQPLVQFARRHNLMLIEDCAQAYVGPAYQGHPQAHISMFSFGPIKTNTSLAGGVFKVRDKLLHEQLQHAHQQWPRQSRRGFGWRAIKYGWVKFLSLYLVAGLIAGFLRLLGRDHDELAVRLSRGFPGPEFFGRIRRQPSTVLLWLMNRRFERFNSDSIAYRTRRGNQLAAALDPHVIVVGRHMLRQTWWVMPLMVAKPRDLVEQMWRIGFDATPSCSLRPIPGRDGQPDPELVRCAFLLQHIVYLPFDERIPSEQLQRMAQAIQQLPTAVRSVPAEMCDELTGSRPQRGRLVQGSEAPNHPADDGLIYAARGETANKV